MRSRQRPRSQRNVLRADLKPRPVLKATLLVGVEDRREVLTTDTYEEQNNLMLPA